MAQIVLSDVTVTLANVTIPTNGVKSCTITFNPDIKDNTGMGMTAKSRKIGLQDWSIDLEIYQDFDDEQLDEDLWAVMYGTGNVGAISIKPTSAGVGASNPNYNSAAGFLESYTPVAAGEVGELGIVRVRILALGAKLERSV